MTDGALDAESHRLNIAEKTIREFAEKMSEAARGLEGWLPAFDTNAKRQRARGLIDKLLSARREHALVLDALRKLSDLRGEDEAKGLYASLAPLGVRKEHAYNEAKNAIVDAFVEAHDSRPAITPYDLDSLLFGVVLAAKANQDASRKWNDAASQDEREAAMGRLKSTTKGLDIAIARVKRAVLGADEDLGNG